VLDGEHQGDLWVELSRVDAIARARAFVSPQLRPDETAPDPRDWPVREVTVLHVGFSVYYTHLPPGNVAAAAFNHKPELLYLCINQHAVWDWRGQKAAARYHAAEMEARRRGREYAEQDGRKDEGVADG